MPETIQWKAPDGGMDELSQAKGLLLGLWDGAEKSALRIDLWTKKMMVDEMNDLAGRGETRFAPCALLKQLAAEHRTFYPKGSL